MFSFDFIDLFAGLGGFHLAGSSLGGRCVFASEIDPELRKIYAKNFQAQINGDINSCSLDEIPRHDVLFGGFPCQPFSKAGAQLGWKDLSRGTLFFKILEILEKRQPEIVVLENVANFSRHDAGNTLKVVESSLRQLGYDVSSKNFSPHQFLIPQLRERVYIVARRFDKGGLNGFDWPAEEHGPVDLSTILGNSSSRRTVSAAAQQALDLWQEFIEKFSFDKELPSFPIWAQEFGATYSTERDSLFAFSKAQLRSFRGSLGRDVEGATKIQMMNCFPSHARYTESCFPTWKRTFIAQNRALYEENKNWLIGWIEHLRDLPPSFTKLEWNCKGSRRDIFDHVLQFRASGIRVKRRSYAPALVAMTTSQVPFVGWERGFLTERECARLQSMEELRFLPEAQTRAFKALGNAVNVGVARRIVYGLMALSTRQQNNPNPRPPSKISSAAANAAMDNRLNLTVEV